MRPKTALLLLIIALVMLQSGLHAASGDPLATEVTLYAHTDPSATSAKGRVLTLNANSTARQAADVRDSLAFTLVPSLSAPLRILGISVYVWLLSQSSVQGTLRVAVSEVMANSSAREIRSTSVTTGLPSTPYQVLVTMGLGGTNQTLMSSSALRLEVQFSPAPARPVPVSLLWDNPSAPTRVVLLVEAYPKISLRVTDATRRVATIFPMNETGMANLVAEASVEEPFGGANIAKVSLRVTNSSGYPFIKDAPMKLASRVELPLQLVYALAIAIPQGRFNVTVSVLDIAKRTFLVTREITVTPFHTLILFLIDPHKRPVPGLNVSLSAAGQLIDEVTTDSTGTAVTRLPSSSVVGPITLRVLRNRVEILPYPIGFNLTSDSTSQIEVPLYDWTFVVRLETMNLPVSAARVDLYLNGKFLASNATDSNGVAVFPRIPLGTYEVNVTSSVATKRFLNVSHTSELKETTLELPILSTPISEGTILILGGIAVVAVFGAFVMTHRRTRTRRFKHVAELLGGTIPESAVVMIVGSSGSGKTLLLQNLLADTLRLGRRCVYVSNSELPSKIKDRLAKMGLEVEAYQGENTLRFVDAYSGGTGIVSSEKHSVPSPRDLTALGMQITSCLEEVGGVGDVFFDSLAPIVAAGDSAQAFNFVQYYGARIVKSGGTLLYVASTALESELLSRFEEASDCVLQTERCTGPGRVRGRLLVRKARGLQYQEGWIGFKIMPNGRMEFISLPAEKQVA
jgi:KaiC/GvpD/RAD55 family RecA-like ATPase